MSVFCLYLALLWVCSEIVPVLTFQPRRSLFFSFFMEEGVKLKSQILLINMQDPVTLFILSPFSHFYFLFVYPNDIAVSEGKEKRKLLFFYEARMGGKM